MNEHSSVSQMTTDMFCLIFNMSFPTGANSGTVTGTV